LRGRKRDSIPAGKRGKGNEENAGKNYLDFFGRVKMKS
jgi:hypothetical protein